MPSVPSNMLIPSLVFLLAWLCTMSISTIMPSLWASSIIALSSSGVPNLLLACKQLGQLLAGLPVGLLGPCVFANPAVGLQADAVQGHQA